MKGGPGRDDDGRKMKAATNSTGSPRMSGPSRACMRLRRYANGVALAKDESFVAVVETNRFRVLRYWLKGPRVGGCGLGGRGCGDRACTYGIAWAGMALAGVAQPAQSFQIPALRTSSFASPSTPITLQQKLLSC